MQLRKVKPEDQDGITTLIDTVYQQYGEKLCLEGADADLLDIETNYLGRGGEFMVLDEGGTICGTHATLPLENRESVCTFRRLYLAPHLRGQGWGDHLMQWALDWAAEHHIQQIEFWSDTRFQHAHRFFKRFGFQKGEVRTMTDAFEPYQEYYFSKNL